MYYGCFFNHVTIKYCVIAIFALKLYNYLLIWSHSKERIKYFYLHDIVHLCEATTLYQNKMGKNDGNYNG